MMEEVIWREQREDVHVATNRIEFSKLESLSLSSLPSLKGFCRGIDHIDFPQLKHLDLYTLERLNCLFHNNSTSHSEENDDAGFLSLFPQMGHTGFQYIQTLEIINCQWLRYVFAPTVTKSIPQLRTLEIWSCRMLSRIVTEENGLGESSVDEVEFPRLEKLVLRDPPNLVNFFPNGNATLQKSTDHLHTPMQSQPLFNEKVTFPSLEVLILEQLPNVSDIRSCELPDFSFFKLKELVMNDISSLRNMSHPSLARVLLNLRRLTIDNCWKMEAVVEREEEIEDGQRIKIEKTLFPELTDLKLSKLPNLRRFCNFTHPIDCHCHDSIC